MSLKVYLAGPDVFLENAGEVLANKAKLVAEAGFEPIIPDDLDIKPVGARIEWGIAISQADEKNMRDSDLVIANLTPFRGISADAGTVYELGYMAASGKPIFGYSNSAKSYLERNSDFYDGAITRVSEEKWSAPDGTNIENFDMGENLMIEGAILARNGVFIREDVPSDAVWTDLKAFKRCLQCARERLLSPGVE